MSNKVREEEQLLQDASTLLMFANVAAKHQHHLQKSPDETHKSVSFSPVQSASAPHQTQTQSQSPPQQQLQQDQQSPPVVSAPATLVQPRRLTVNQVPNQASVNQAQASQHPPRNPIGTSSVSVMLNPASSMNYPPAHPTLPAISTQVRNPSDVQSPLIMHPQAPAPPTIPQYSFPQLGAHSQQAQPAVSVNSQQHTLASFLNSSDTTQAQSAPTASIQPATPNVITPPAPSAVPSRSSRSSISILMNSPEPSELPKETQRASIKQEIPETAAIPAARTTIPSPKPFPGAAYKTQKSVSPPSNILPVQGSFTQGHKRAKSTPDIGDKNKKSTLSQVARSPGPANVALARGINLETGERNDNNARIAAAALAAAADIPLPLKTIASATPVKIERTVSNPAQFSSQRKEEETEPENDDKTDDENTDDENQKIRSNDSTVSPKAARFASPPANNQSTKLPNLAHIMSNDSATPPVPVKAPETNVAPHAPVPVAVPVAVSVTQPVTTTLPVPSQPAITRSLPVTQPEPTSKATEQSVAATDLASRTPTAGIPTFKVPPLESYKVDPDSGLIGCICGIEDDDGFTIQCDICYRWQHCVCMGYKTNEEVPEDEYRCYYCDENKWGKFNAEICRDETLARLDIDKSSIDDRYGDQDQLNEEYDQKQQIHHEQRKQQGIEHSQLQDNAGKVESTNKRKSSGSEKSEKKRRVEKDGHVTTAVDKTSPVVPSSADNQSLPSSNSVLTSPKQQVPEDILPNKNNVLLEDGVTSETYQSVYFNLQDNDYKRPSIKQQFGKLGEAFYNNFLALPKADQAKKEYLGIEIMPLSKFKTIKFCRKILPNLQKYHQESKINIIKKNKFNKFKIQVKPYSESQKQKFNGISKLALFISASSSDLLEIPKNTPIIEYLGEIDLFENYVKDPISQYSGWGTTKVKVLKSNVQISDDQKIEVVVDSRFVGNESRFIRKSCPITSNCEIKKVYIPETNSFKYLVVTSEDITLKSDSSEEELRLNWEWDRSHPILKLYENNSSEKFENLSNLEKSTLISCVDNLLHFTECGCSTSSNYSSCAIFKVKKATSYLLRSTRKASSISNVNLTKSKEELVLPKKEKEYIPWDERLLQRDKIIQMNLTVSTSNSIPGTSSDSIEEFGDAENNANDIIEEKDEVNISEHSNSMQDAVSKKASNLFKIPSKQQLFIRNQQLVQKFKKMGSSNEDSDKDAELESIVENNPPIVNTSTFSLPIPIVSNILVKIEKSIDDELKPVLEEVGTKALSEIIPSVSSALPPTGESGPISIAVEKASTASKLPIPVVDEKMNIETEQPKAPIPVTKQEAEKVQPPLTNATPPTFVKKLSFADYKKKMK